MPLSKHFEIMFGTLLGKILDWVAPCFSHPYLDIELISNGFGKRNNGLIPSKEPIHVTEAVYNYDFHWDYLMIIKNNSSIPAFSLDIIEQPSFFHIITPMNKTASLQPFEKLELKCYVQHTETMKGRDSVQKQTPIPYFIDKIQVVLSYKNERHKRFHTTFEYNNDGQNNDYKKIKI